MTKQTEAPRPGRPREYANPAAKQKAYRERVAAKGKAQRRAIRWCKQFCVLILDTPDPKRLRALAETVAKHFSRDSE